MHTSEYFSFRSYTTFTAVLWCLLWKWDIFWLGWFLSSWINKRESFLLWSEQVENTPSFNISVNLHSWFLHRTRKVFPTCHKNTLLLFQHSGAIVRYFFLGGNYTILIRLVLACKRNYIMPQTKRAQFNETMTKRNSTSIYHHTRMWIGKQIHVIEKQPCKFQHCFLYNICTNRDLVDINVFFAVTLFIHLLDCARFYIDCLAAYFHSSNKFNQNAHTMFYIDEFSLISLCHWLDCDWIYCTKQCAFYCPCILIWRIIFESIKSRIKIAFWTLSVSRIWGCRRLS